MEIGEELKAKALACETAEELLAQAAENGIELAPEEAELILQGGAKMPEGELADDELEGVAGGAAGCKRNAHEVVYWDSPEEVEFLFKIGDIKQAFVGRVWGNETATVRITHSEAVQYNGRWVDAYDYDRISGSPTVFGFQLQVRSRFEKQPNGSSVRCKNAPPEGGAAVFEGVFLCTPCAAL